MDRREKRLSLYYLGRPPDFGDALVFYGADLTSESLQDSLKRELTKHNPNGWAILFEVLGIAGAEKVKVDVNGQIYPPFTSIRDFDANQRKRRGLMLPSTGLGI
jgi:hypothetical protein